MLDLALAPPSLNSGVTTAQSYFTLPLLSSLLVCHLAEVPAELIFVRSLLVIHFKSGDRGTVWIFGYGSEEESLGRSDNHHTWLVEASSLRTMSALLRRVRLLLIPAPMK